LTHCFLTTIVISQYDLQQIIRQQQEHLAVMQAQIQILLAGEKGEEAIKKSNTGSNIEVVKPLVFNGEASRAVGFIIVYKLYLRMRISEALIKEQIQ